MKVLDAIVAPLVLMILLAVGYAFVLGGGQLKFTKNLVKWVIIFAVFSFLARACIPHG